MSLTYNTELSMSLKYNTELLNNPLIFWKISAIVSLADTKDTRMDRK